MKLMVKYYTVVYHFTNKHITLKPKKEKKNYKQQRFIQYPLTQGC